MRMIPQLIGVLVLLSILLTIVLFKFYSLYCKLKTVKDEVTELEGKLERSGRFYENEKRLINNIDTIASTIEHFGNITTMRSNMLYLTSNYIYPESNNTLKKLLSHKSVIATLDSFYKGYSPESVTMLIAYLNSVKEHLEKELSSIRLTRGL